nr:hypothetical protein [Helicobacter pylori]
MEKILAFFIPSFLVSGLFWGGGVTYKPTLKSPKSLAFFKSHLFLVSGLFWGGGLLISLP